MARKQYDGVVEAVRYAPDGQVELVRMYERRGATYSDRILLSRQDLVSRLKARKHFVLGQRLPYLASTFDVNFPVQLVGTPGQENLVAGDSKAGDHDRLQGAPLF